MSGDEHPRGRVIRSRAGSVTPSWESRIVTTPSWAAAGLVTVVAGCGSSGASSSPPATPHHRTTATTASTRPTTTKVVRVAISNFAYAPKTIRVHPGTKITWDNHDSTAYTATATNHSFDTGTINARASRSVTVTKPGAYRDICSFHPFMHGTIIVR